MAEVGATPIWGVEEKHISIPDIYWSGQLLARETQYSYRYTFILMLGGACKADQERRLIKRARQFTMGLYRCRELAGSGKSGLILAS
jgi:hypothetical protein